VALPESVLDQHNSAGSHRRFSPSLVSNSTHPVSQMTSCCTGVTCQPVSRIPEGTRAKRLRRQGPVNFTK
jgi:hypothetical protein